MESDNSFNEDIYSLSIFKNDLTNIDRIDGPDVVSLSFLGYPLWGYFDKSPLEEKIIKTFDYQPIKNNQNKPYKALFHVEDNKLNLLFVNGKIGEKRFYTLDLIPDFPDDNFLYFCEFYSGKLHLVIQQGIIPPVFNRFLTNQNYLILTFRNGILVEIGGDKLTISPQLFDSSDCFA
jgi:hypothetical protein